jgi:hypothetical protein
MDFLNLSGISNDLVGDVNSENEGELIVGNDVLDIDELDMPPILMNEQKQWSETEVET